MRLLLPSVTVAVVMVAALTLLASTGMADMGTDLTQSMYCDVKNLFSGKIGMLVGLVIGVMGLMKMVQGSMGGGLFLIVCGVLVTSLPSIIEGSLTGLGSVLTDAGISDKAPGGSVGCSGGWTSVTERD